MQSADNPADRKRSRSLRRPALQLAAVGLAVLDAASLQAKPLKIDGLRVAATPLPKSDGDAYQTARGLLAAGDITGAMAMFRQALLDDPRSVDALNGLGVCYDRMGRYDLARPYYESALAIDPASAISLNNLGYSLYLSGSYQAAIPILQQVAASHDPAASANGRRLLTLTASRMREAAAIASTALAKAELAAAPQALAQADDAPAAEVSLDTRTGKVSTIPAPRLSVATQTARIEQSSNGEQRLVLGAPVPDRALKASLGDAAVLVLVAPAWTAGDERALALAEAARERIAARAAAADLAELFATEREAEVAIANIGDPDLSRRLAAAFPAIESDGTAIATPPVHPAAVASIVPATTKRRRDTAAIATSAPGRSDRGSGPHNRTAIARSEDVSPAWLFAVRRADHRKGATPKEAGQGPTIAESVLAFESDDRTLNQFAARMRGAPAAPTPAQISDADAIARLELLLARMRA